MAKINSVKSARASKKARSCTICSHEVEVKESYKYIEKKTGPTTGYTLFFCYEHNPKLSHTMSGRAAEAQQAIESFEEADKGTIENMKDALTSFAEDITNFSEELEGAGDSIEEGFGHETAQSEAMKNTANEYREWADKMSEHAEATPDSRGTVECSTCKEQMDNEAEDAPDNEEVEPDETGNCPQCGDVLIADGEFTETKQEWFDEAESITGEQPDLDLGL